MKAIDLVENYLRKHGAATHAQLDKLLRRNDVVTYNLPDVIYQLRNGNKKRRPLSIETIRYRYRGKLCTRWVLLSERKAA